MCFLRGCLRVALLPVDICLPQVQVLWNTTRLGACLSFPDGAMCSVMGLAESNHILCNLH